MTVSPYEISDSHGSWPRLSATASYLLRGGDTLGRGATVHLDAPHLSARLALHMFHIIFLPLLRQLASDGLIS